MGIYVFPCNNLALILGKQVLRGSVEGIWYRNSTRVKTVFLFMSVHLDSAKHWNQVNSAGIYLLKVNKRNTRTRCEICSELTVVTPKRCQCRRLVSLSLTLNIFHTLFYCLHCWLWAGKRQLVNRLTNSVNLFCVESENQYNHFSILI